MKKKLIANNTKDFFEHQFVKIQSYAKDSFNKYFLNNY